MSNLCKKKTYCICTLEKLIFFSIVATAKCKWKVSKWKHNNGKWKRKLFFELPACQWHDQCGSSGISNMRQWQWLDEVVVVDGRTTYCIPSLLYLDIVMKGQDHVSLCYTGNNASPHILIENFQYIFLLMKNGFVAVAFGLFAICVYLNRFYQRKMYL